MRSLGGGGGGEYSYIRVLHDGFLLKAIVFTVCEHEYMNNPPPPPINASRNGPAYSRDKVQCFFT